MDSLFLGGILAISSTTIILRAFEELGLKTQQFAGLVFGILVIEDLVAILLLVLLSTLAVSQQFAGTELLLSVGKLGFFLVIWFMAGIYLIPSFLRSTQKLISNETLLILAIALCLLMVVLVTKAGFSAALGAFVMGSILAETLYAEKIEHLMQPVKDLFGAVFFVSVGMLIDPSVLLTYAGPVALLSVVVILGKSIHVTLGALLSGQPLRQSLQTGLSMAQIGEFSFIIATLGLNLKVTSDFLYPIAVAVSAITTFTTPYLIRLAGPLHEAVERVLPARWKAMLNTYTTGTRTIASVSDWRKLVNTYLQIVFINSVIIISIILLATRYLTPLVRSTLASALWAKVITALVALAFMAPFIWALSIRKIRTEAYNHLWRNRKFNRGPLVALEAGRVVLGVLLVGFLLDQLFSPVVALLGAVVIIAGFLPMFTHKLQATYTRIERRFLYNLNAREFANGSTLEGAVRNRVNGKGLLPWDAHLAEFEVSPDAAIIGKTLQELAFRERHGVNVARIERGRNTIVAPKGTERVFPFDKITVVGTDEQLRLLKPVLEPPQSQLPAMHPEVTLKQLVIDDKFPFLGMSIRVSGIREKTSGLIIGIERNGQRMLNPDPGTVFQKGDIVWLSGDRELVRAVGKE
jgi:CPA2 family monovalent cation:H+ antiporter-2